MDVSQIKHSLHSLHKYSTEPRLTWVNHRWPVAHCSWWRSVKSARHSQMTVFRLQQHTRSWMFGQLRPSWVSQVRVKIDHLQQHTLHYYTTICSV